MDWPMLVKLGLACFTAGYWSALFVVMLDNVFKGKK